MRELPPCALTMTTSKPTSTYIRCEALDAAAMLCRRRRRCLGGWVIQLVCEDGVLDAAPGSDGTWKLVDPEGVPLDSYRVGLWTSPSRRPGKRVAAKFKQIAEEFFAEIREERSLRQFEARPDERARW